VLLNAGVIALQCLNQMLVLLVFVLVGACAAISGCSVRTGCCKSCWALEGAVDAGPDAGGKRRAEAPVSSTCGNSMPGR
jgi:hypothetical protein